MRRALLIALGALALACGGFDNRPLETGRLEGQLQGAEAGFAMVAVVGHPELRASVDEGGRFVLSGVPRGALELWLVASPTRAARQSVTVKAATVTQLGTIEPGLAASVSLQARGWGAQRLGGGFVEVLQSPLGHLALSEDGHARVGPLPAGCYTLHAQVPGVGDATIDRCVTAGQSAAAELPLVPSDDELHQGCRVSGCADEKVCAPDGRCVECLGDETCQSGLSCIEGRCQGELAACAPCTDDVQCGAGHCEELSGSEARVCVQSCDATVGCETAGFACVSGRCVPAPAQLSGCFAYLQVGASCDSDDLCRSLGITHGECVHGRCTFQCSEGDCPLGFSCSLDEGVQRCVPNG